MCPSWEVSANQETLNLLESTCQIASDLVLFYTSQEIIGISLNFNYFVNINYCISYIHWYTLKFPMNVLEVETLFDKYKDW